MKNQAKNQEVKEPRALEVLVQEFKNSVGNFNKFNRGMDSREKILFKGWLQNLRTNPQIA
jgi:hypothetical protein